MKSISTASTMPTAFHHRVKPNVYCHRLTSMATASTMPTAFHHRVNPSAVGTADLVTPNSFGGPGELKAHMS